MASIAEQIREKPWTGWAMAGVLAIALVLVIIRFFNRESSEFSSEALSEWVVVKYTDTEEEEKMTRGELLKRMLAAPKGSLSGETGLVNPKSGKPTGFLIDKGTWTSMLQKVEAERDAVAKGRTAPAPQAPTAPPAPRAQ